MTITVVAFAFLLYVLYSHTYSFKKCRYIFYLSLLTYFSYIGEARSVRIAGIAIIIFIIIVTEKTSIRQNTTFRQESSCV
jgi:hypothetical protein